MTEDIRVERLGRVLRVTLCRPDKHNALSRPMLARLRAVFTSHRDDEALACAVIAAEGQRYFAAGGDLRDLAEARDEPDVRTMSEQGRAALDAVRDFPLPVIALLNGDAIGGGAELAVACDLRVLREGAGIGYVHGRLAITAAWGGGADLVALVGPARALRMMTTKQLVPAATALAWGLADAVAPAATLERELGQFLAPLLEQSSAALRGFKAIVRSARRGEGYDARRAVELGHFVATWTHPDHWAAVERILSRSTSGDAADDSQA